MMKNRGALFTVVMITFAVMDAFLPPLTLQSPPSGVTGAFLSPLKLRPPPSLQPYHSTTSLAARLSINAPLDSYKAIYDMILVVRLEDGKPILNIGADAGGADGDQKRLESGLFITKEKDGGEKPPFYLCKVLSVGEGREREDGTIEGISDVGGVYEFEVGDEVVLKNPWGIGPKDEEDDSGRRFSYARVTDVAAIVRRAS